MTKPQRLFQRSAIAVALLAGLGVAPGIPGCADGKDLLHAKQVEDRAELIGGPVAMADLGDFLLENDQIRVNILRAKDSPGPGVFGGSIVDVDVRRERVGDENNLGHDRFAELFPIANLLVPDPEGLTAVRVLKDGSDGKEASIRVDGTGAFLFEALAILRNQKDLLGALFPNIKTQIHFRTDYILRPGDRHVTIKTVLMLEEPGPDGCDAPPVCDLNKCERGFKADANGCPTCECGEPLQLDQTQGVTSVFDTIFGDNQNTSNPKPVHHAGILAGDFVFFGNQTDVWAPHMGFDEEKTVNEAAYAGRNTFQKPLTFDFVAASSSDVSYGYFTAPREGEGATVVNVPIIASAATAFLAATKSCLFDKSDDADCDNKRAFIYERYLAVGDGDIASVADDVWKTRKTPTGTVQGVVQMSTGAAGANAHVYLFRDPDAKRVWNNVDEVAEANYRAENDVGLLDVVDADVGLDLVEDGDFKATIPPGTYLVVARSEDGMSLSKPERISVTAGQTVEVDPVLPEAATIEYRVSDESGALTPAKISLTSLDANDQPRERDGDRRPYLGDGRLGNGVRSIESSATGTGSLRIEPGRYRIVASRGPEFSIFKKDVTVESGGIKRFDAIIAHEVDTTGWMSTDMHLHSQPSFDSGMPLPRRLTTVVDEQVELAIPTDHDVETDYTPTIRELFFTPYVTTAVGVETTTIEQGHFIAFPLKYDSQIQPTHGSHDPTCESGAQIIDAMHHMGNDDLVPLTILAHPRDGFFGYIDQLGVDPFTMARKLGTLEEKNPVFRTASCDFDAMELINGKRFDLVRTATVEEVVDYNRCRARLDAAKDEAELATVCPEMSAGLFAPCKAGERFDVCKARNRTALAWESMKRILIRTPEEEEALWNFPLTAEAGQPLCNPKTYGNGPVPRDAAQQPCTYRSGHVDDYFRYLEHGMIKTQIASSDSHDGVHEPGYPRTWFQSPTDDPAALSINDAVETLRTKRAAITSYGPFIRANIDGKTFGETAKATRGGKVTLDLHVSTASWFGVDRIEIYENGHLVQVKEPKNDPTTIDDFNEKVVLDVPAEHRDDWIVVIAMGLQNQNLMSPVVVDVPFGEIQLSKVTSDAFALIPVVNTFFGSTPTLPDWFPTPAYAVSNPIYLDTDATGAYEAPLPLPEFCSKTCNPKKFDAAQCPTKQICLDPEGVCGVPIPLTCKHRTEWTSTEH
jgi:hypothetical protein